MEPDDNEERGSGKKWQDVVNGFFAVPAILIFGFLMLEMFAYAIGMFVVFGSLLFASGIKQAFHLLPPLTRGLIISSPLVFLLGLIIGQLNLNQEAIIILAVFYGSLNIISNLSIPKHVNRARNGT